MIYELGFGEERNTFFCCWDNELTACLSIFYLSKLNELWPYYQKHVN